MSENGSHVPKIPGNPPTPPKKVKDAEMVE